MRQERERLELLKAEGDSITKAMLKQAGLPVPDEDEGEGDTVNTIPELDLEGMLPDKHDVSKLNYEFPLNTHKVVLEHCLKLLEADGSVSDDQFQLVMDCMAIRLKYKHFFDPPLVDIVEEVLLCRTFGCSKAKPY